MGLLLKFNLLFIIFIYYHYFHLLLFLFTMIMFFFPSGAGLLHDPQPAAPSPPAHTNLVPKGQQGQGR